MVRTREIKRATISKSFTSRGSTPRPKSAVALLVVSTLAAIWAAAMLSPFGNLANAYMFVFTAFFAGPATLVSLSLTVMVGLVATDRIVLLIQHRVLLQSAHRSLGIIAVFSLVLHVLTKISAGHISPTTALLPFVSGADVYVGLGTVAGAMMVGVLWTGLIRARFAGVGKPWLWRTLHSISYAAWPIALVHGLQAGRAAATWVTLSYLLCMGLVVALLGVRLSVTLGRKREEQSQGTGSMAPVGKAARARGPVRTSSTAPAPRRTADEIRASRRNAPAQEGRRTAVDAPRSRRDSRWDDQDTMGGRRSDPEIRIGRGDDRDTMGGRRGDPEIRVGREDDRDTLSGRTDDRESRVGRRRRESLNDLRDEDSTGDIDSWARAGTSDTMDSSRRRSDRFAVPEVPLPKSPAAGPAPDPELPWDSPRRWATSEPEDPWDRPRRGADDSVYRRPPSDDAPLGPADGADLGADPAAGDRRSRRAAEDGERRSWREPDDEPTPAGAARAGGRRRASEAVGERPTERSGRRDKGRADVDAEESTAEWGRAARYEPDLADGPDDDDDAGRPALIDLDSRRARKSSGSPGRSSRRKESDEAAEEGAYWTNLKGQV